MPLGSSVYITVYPSVSTNILFSLSDQIINFRKNKIERNKESLKSAQNLKIEMLQVRFEWACSWTVLESASYVYAQ
jgi:hypothetical protein